MNPASVVSIVTIVLFGLTILWGSLDPHAPVLLIVFVFGAVSGLLREHLNYRKKLRIDPTAEFDLRLVGWSPVVGGVLAVVLTVVIASGLVSGDLFPTFAHVTDAFESPMRVMKGVQPETNRDFLKLLVWATIAGYFEHVVTKHLEKLAG